VYNTYIDKNENIKKIIYIEYKNENKDKLLLRMQIR